MGMMIVRHKVRDYGQWRPIFDRHAEGLGTSSVERMELDVAAQNLFIGRKRRDRENAQASPVYLLKVVRGKRLTVVDDSIVRGTTTKQIVALLRKAGATEVHVRISAPPIYHPCFYGIDFPTRQELIAHERSVDEIRDFLEVDSLAYLSVEGMLSCLQGESKHYCTACWTGKYKVSVEEPVSKFGFERDQLRMF